MINEIVRKPLWAPDEHDAGNSDSILDIFNMEFSSDPKEPEPETPPVSEPAPKPEEKGDEQNPANVESVPAEPEPEVASKAEEPKVTAPTSDALLADALKAINLMATQKTQQNPQRAESQEPSDAEEEDEDAKVFKPKEFSDYTFSISSKLYNGLFNPDSTEEERINCLQAFAAGISATVHNRILGTLGKWTRENFNSIPGAVNYLISQRERTQSSAKSIREDFYNSFPELNKPEIAPLVKATIQAVQRETGAKTWNANIKNLVGNRIKGVLQAYSSVYSNTNKPVAPKITPTGVTPVPAKVVDNDPNSSTAILDVVTETF